MHGKVLLVVALIALTYNLAFASPLDLGNGGVFNSPEAQEYWATRFGGGFFSNLASIQRGIDAQASRQRAQLKVEVEEPLIDLRTNDLESVQAPPQVLAVHPGPLFYEQVHF